MKKKPNKVKKSQQQLHRYKNMVKYKTEDEYTDNDEIFIKDLQGTNETIDDVNAMAVKTENKIQNIEENIKEIRTFIENKYIMKDLHDVQIENLKEKINELEEEINN